MPRSTSPTKKVATVPVPATVPALTQPSLIQTIQHSFGSGLGSGIGFSLARSAMEKILPPSRVCHEPCLIERNAYENCILTQDSEAFCGDRRMALRDCMKSGGLK